MSLVRNIGFGTTLGCDPTGSTTFAVLANIKTPPSGPNVKVDMVDVSLLSEKWKSFSGAQGNPGEVTFDIAYDLNDTNTTTILTALLANSDVANWEVTYALGATKTQTFLGIVSGFDRKTSVTECQEATVTITVNGTPGV